MEQKKEVLRVAHIVGKMIGGGVEAFIMNYYRNIDREKIQFDFIIDSDSKFVPREEIESLGGRIIVVPPYQKIFQYQKELRKIFRENKYKIVHSHLNTLSVFPLFCAYREKVPVRIAHSHSTTNKKEWKKNILKHILRPLSKIFATNYMACSEYAGRWLFGNRVFDEGKVNIINNAIDTNKFKYNKGVREKVRKELKVNGKYVLGNVGRFVAQKNHMFLINIFGEIYKNDKNTVLILIGEGPLENEVKQKVNNLGLSEVVMFLEHRENVNDFMQAMDCFIFPSLYEGLGIVTIEAQCSGLPCICSNNVPEETQITDIIKYVDLEESKEKWKKEILYFYEFKRYDYSELIVANKYDIKKESTKLLEKYIELGEVK